jgi:hypothetical protein
MQREMLNVIPEALESLETTARKLHYLYRDHPGKSARERPWEKSLPWSVNRIARTLP